MTENIIFIVLIDEGNSSLIFFSAIKHVNVLDTSFYRESLKKKQ